MKHSIRLLGGWERSFFLAFLALLCLVGVCALIPSLSPVTFTALLCFSLFLLIYLCSICVRASQTALGMPLLNLHELYFSIIAILFMALYYCYIVFSARWIRTWDYAVYYLASLNVPSTFQGSFTDGFVQLLRSIQYDDYNTFLLLFVLLPFRLTNQTNNAFIVSYFVTMIIPTVFLLFVVAKRVISSVPRSAETVAFVVCGFLVITFPALHEVASKGMPDIIGIFFATVLILLAWDYDFDKLRPKRLLAMVVAALCLFFSRRWYTFWLVGFFTSYFIYTVVASVLRKNKSIVRTIFNIGLFSVFTALLLVLFFSPMLQRILNDNIQANYSAYKRGDLFYELFRQYWRLGFLFTAFIAVGWILSLINPRLRKMSCILFGTTAILLFLFGRVQNMSAHHGLLLVPFCLFCLFAVIASLSALKCKRIASGLMLCFLAVSFATTFIPPSSRTAPALFSNIDLHPRNRNDLSLINNINDFIKTHCTPERQISMLLATDTYNYEIFRNEALPDKTLFPLIVKEYSVDLVHGFPYGFYDAAYVLVANPIQLSSYATPQLLVPELIKAVTEVPEIAKKFQKQAEFAQNGILFTIYERILPADIQEKQYLLDILQKRYPDSDVFAILLQ